MKICRTCKVEKPLSSFYKHPETKDRLRSECKECWNKSSLDYYSLNKTEINEKRKDYHFRSNYGLSREDVERMKDEQNGLCAICKEFQPLVVDHDHVSGKVRKLLCNRCNLAVGYLRDNPGWAEKAAAYLERHKAIQNA